ncbi:hypothetical protein JHK86_021754 [Glycine max]|nr:hypothetical protein JHK86_021754 [Glycine max]
MPSGNLTLLSSFTLSLPSPVRHHALLKYAEHVAHLAEVAVQCERMGLWAQYVGCDELSSTKNQLLQGFSPDDAYPSGPPLFMETSRPCSPLA